MPKLMSEKSANTIVHYVTGLSERVDSLQYTYHEVVLPNYYKHLAHKGVNIPFWGSQAAAALSLLTVAHSRGEMLHKKLGTRILNRFGYDTQDCQEFRHLYGRSWGFNVIGSSHLKAQGYDVKRGTYYLMDLENSSSLFVQGKDANSPVRSYINHTCSYCHGLPGQENMKFGGIIQEVKDCHGDPRKPWIEDEHVIQCDICNRTLRDVFVFNNIGQIIARL